MIILKKFDFDTAQGEWSEREIYGQKVGFKIRPRNDDLLQEIRDKHKTTINGVDQHDDAKVNDAMVDYTIEDIRGFEEEDGTAIAMTLKNKKRIIGTPLPMGEQSLWAWVLNESIKKAVRIREDETRD